MMVSTVMIPRVPLAERTIVTNLLHLGSAADGRSRREEGKRLAEAVRQCSRDEATVVRQDAQGVEGASLAG